MWTITASININEDGMCSRLELYCIKQKLIEQFRKLWRAGQKEIEHSKVNVQMSKEGNVLFNDALNTFYLHLYGVRDIVKYHTDNERGNPLPAQGLLFLIDSKGSFICTIPQTRLHIPRPLLHQSWSTGWNDMSMDECNMRTVTREW